MSKTMYFKFLSHGEELYGKIDNVPDEMTVDDINQDIIEADEGTLQEITEEEYDEESYDESEDAN